MFMPKEIFWVKDGREVDFTLTKDDKIISMIEVKVTDDKPSKALIWFQEKYGFSAVQVVKELRHEYQAGNITIRQASSFLKELAL